uniref:Peptidyl-tRNA hydrolase n=1 Tax=Hyaloperonospora arabidopsidis (strain Emoy2) TaxID=559515 RepID=M4B2E2_HYAAE
MHSFSLRHNIGSVVVKHFLETYASQVTAKPLHLQHEARHHGDVARFCVAFPWEGSSATHHDYHPRDDLVNRSSKRAKERTLKEGVPHDKVNVAVLLPTTYMNCSGTAVRAFMQSHHWRLKKNPLALNRHDDELLVVTDDVALPFGECRFKARGGPGGQNGVRDIIKCVGTDRFARLRIGVGAPYWFVGGNSGAPAGTAMDKFVLGRFNGDEQEAMPDLLRYTNELLRLYLHRGVAQSTTVANKTIQLSHTHLTGSARSSAARGQRIKYVVASCASAGVPEGPASDFCDPSGWLCFCVVAGTSDGRVLCWRRPRRAL